MHDHLRDTQGVRANIGKRAAIDFWRTVSDERDQHWGPMLERLLGHPDHPEWFQQAMHFVRHGHGEGAAMAALSVAQGAATQGVSQVLAAELAPIIHADLAKLAPFLLDPPTAAQLAARGIVKLEDAAKEAAGSGYNAWRFERMMEGAEVYPDFGAAIELLRRKKINAGEFRYWMRRNGIPEDVAGQLLELAEQPIDPADLALQVLKGIRTEREVITEAADFGVNEERLKRLILMTGEPPGPEQLGEAYRRNLIDEQRFTHGIRQSRIRDEWVDVLLKLRYQPASPADAIRGLVQKHLDEQKAKEIAQEGGLRPEDFQWLYETAGNPPGMMQMIDLWRRGKTTRERVAQAIREGRTKDKYVDELLNLRRMLPQTRQVISIVTHGGMTEQEGARLLHEHGLDPTVVKGMIHAATSSQAVREKTLARAEIQELYYDHAIDEAEALKHLHTLGYTPATAKLVLSMVDLRRERALQQAAMSPIKSGYIARQIDEAQASAALDKLGINHKQRDFALRMWTVDREAHTKLLSEAQIVKANKEGLLSDDAAEKRLQALGYHHEDARLLLNMEKGRAHPAP